MRRARRHRFLRRRSHRRRATPPAVASPLLLSLTRGSALSAVDALGGSTLGRAVVLGRDCVLVGRRSLGWPNRG